MIQLRPVLCCLLCLVTYCQAFPSTSTRQSSTTTTMTKTSMTTPRSTSPITPSSKINCTQKMVVPSLQGENVAVGVGLFLGAIFTGIFLLVTKYCSWIGAGLNSEREENGCRTRITAAPSSNNGRYDDRFDYNRELIRLEFDGSTRHQRFQPRRDYPQEEQEVIETEAEEFQRWRNSQQNVGRQGSVERMPRVVGGAPPPPVPPR